MKTTLHYSTFMTLCVHACGMTATVDMGCKSLEDVLDFVQHIFNDDTFFHGESVESVHVIDSETGELIAECVPEESVDDVYDDWGYNEDIGYDPYLGCYTDDC
ncbi:hypothetical protein II906_07375 [bacterium]|nr:hypothetical protein [bacterium]